MATIKSFTDISQSKKLAKILPLESADMLFQLGEDKYADSIRVPLTKEHWEQMMPDIKPCWSLASLLSVLPDCPDLSKHVDDKWFITTYPNDVHTCLMGFDNPVDACVAMIEKLHELNLL